MLKFIITSLFSLILMGLNHMKETQPTTLNYLPLGDSYTICTGASEKESWPVILTKHLNEAGIKTNLVANPARNGFSTQNLIDLELPVLDNNKIDLVTLLIGVNDWVRDVKAADFQKNLAHILDHVQKKLKVKKNILLITIPDFGVTPQGALYSKGRDISEGIAEFNTIIKAEAKKRGLTVTDIFEITKAMKNDPALVANDRLHPSAKEYAIWESLIFPDVKALLSK